MCPRKLNKSYKIIAIHLYYYYLNYIVIIFIITDLFHKKVKSQKLILLNIFKFSDYIHNYIVYIYIDKVVSKYR